MVGLTAGSIAATVFLGWLAYRSGHSAVRIAAEATQRDADYRESEQLKVFRDERTEVARAIITALMSLDLLAHQRLNEAPRDQVRLLVARANETQLQATVQIGLGVRDQSPEAVRTWFVGAYAKLQGSVDEYRMDADYRRIHNNVTIWTQAWRNGDIEISGLPEVQYL